MSDLVLGQSGELGPLDAQLEQSKPGDFRRPRSCVERFKGLEQLQSHSIETFHLLVDICVRQRLQISDACKVATDFTAAVSGPMYARIDPDSLGEHARYLAVGEEYANRVLRRYRSEIYQPSMSRKLVWGYPDHGFVIDLEELAEIGIPARQAEGLESALLESMFELRYLDEEDHEVIVATGDQVETPEASENREASDQPTPAEETGKASIHKVKG